MTNPYENLPPERFWRSAVAERSAFAIEGLWRPKFPIHRTTRVATAGSCFAQHFGRALVENRYAWINAEPAPAGLRARRHAEFHYGTFSFRTGNIYTPSMLAQWLRWALAGQPVPEVVWEKDGRYFDPFRPTVEPGGFRSQDEVVASRLATLAAIRTAVADCEVFVFTLGLTEAWQDSDGFEYAMCPGTSAGTFDPARHHFVNHDYTGVMAGLREALDLMRQANPAVRLLLTVSPVPLTATASDQHVLTATTWSKSVLRAAAGTLAGSGPDIDYFPSYEIIATAPFRGMFYGPNQRSVEAFGVNFVMECFFKEQLRAFGRAAPPPAVADPAAAPEPLADGQPGDPQHAGEDDIRCEEEILGAFAR